MDEQYRTSSLNLTSPAFNKIGISVTTAEYLLDVAISSEQKDNIQKVIEVSNLKVKDASLLLQQFFSALIINDDEGDDIINNELKEDKVEGDPAQGTSGMKPGCPKVNIVEGEPALGSKGMKPGITKDDSKKIYQI